jgi:hypothetical protein
MAAFTLRHIPDGEYTYIGPGTSSIRQMSMPKPVRPNMATITPLGRPWAQTAQEQLASSAPGRSNWTGSHR